MSLAKSNPIHSHRTEDFFRTDSLFAGSNRKSGHRPAVITHNPTDAYAMEAAIPGFAKEEIQLQVENGMPTISGEHRSRIPGIEGKDETTTRSAFSYNFFSRSFSQPGDALMCDIKATCDKGILHSRLPRQKAELSSHPITTKTIR